jgi:hypothetical protein
MRLLERDNDSEFSLAKDFSDDLPRYAILLHTCGADIEEVSFRDLIDDTGKSKAGHDKIWFCGEQAIHDGLQYFWIDTYCTIQTHHRRQCPTKTAASAPGNDGSCHLALNTKLS